MRVVSWILVGVVPLTILWSHTYVAQGGASQLISIPFDVAMLALGAYYFVPDTRLAVVTTKGGVRIQNRHWERHEFKWDEVESFTWGYPEAETFTEVAVLTTKSGERIPLHALYTPNQFTRPKNRTSQNMTTELVKLLEIARSNSNELPASWFQIGKPSPKLRDTRRRAMSGASEQ